MDFNIKKIISGGQTGADRAGLNAAIGFGIKHGGYAPLFSLAEDGKVPSFYKLKEYSVGGYRPRTLQNVLDSDGTVVFTHGTPTSGSALTLKLARSNKIPCLWCNLKNDPDELATTIVEWLNENQIQILNVAGSRQSILQAAKVSGHLVRLILGKAIRLQLTLKLEQ